MRRMRNVKIVATLGPASATREMIAALHSAGADVFRLNMSHGSHEEIRDKHRIIREIEEETGGAIGILADLQGPKLRVGVFATKNRGTPPASACPIRRFLPRWNRDPPCWSMTERYG